MYLSDRNDWRSYAADLGIRLDNRPVLPTESFDLNLPSIQVNSLQGSATVFRSVTSTQAGTWRASTIGLDGIGVVVEPPVLEFAGPGITKNFTATFTRIDAKPSNWTTGYLSWTEQLNGTEQPTGKVARSPVALLPRSGIEGTVPEVALTTEASGSVTLSARSLIARAIEVTTTPLVAGITMPDPVEPVWSPQATGGIGASVDYPFTVSSDTTLARIVVTGGGPEEAHLAASLIAVPIIDGDDGHDTVAVAEGRTDGATTTIEPKLLPAGEYLLRVAATSDAPFAWIVTRFIGDSARPGPELTVSDNQVFLNGTDPATVTVSWKGLAPGTSYLGAIGWGASGKRTLVTLRTAPPAADAGGAP